MRSLALNGFNAVVAATSSKLPDPIKVLSRTVTGTAPPHVTEFEQPADEQYFEMATCGLLWPLLALVDHTGTATLEFAGSGAGFGSAIAPEKTVIIHHDGVFP